MLRPRSGGVFLDATIGGGGHALRLLQASRAVRLIGLDLDPEAIEAAERRLRPFGDRVELIRANFRKVSDPGFARRLGALAGALMDLGVSSHQIDTTARGFSFREGTPLLMRMDSTAGARHARRSAAGLLNSMTERELGRVFREGEERRWRALSREVVRRRKIRPFSTSDDLVAALTAALGRHARPKEKARLFQAVRIAVNDELGALTEGLAGIRRCLGAGGRLAVLSYHSLEDRVVKRVFRGWAKECVCPPGLPECRCRGRPLGRAVERRPLRPSEDEVVRNPRARSARLRVWENAA